MNCYATYDDLIARVASATGYQSAVLAILDAVSREIETYCGRVFSTRIEARDFDVNNVDAVLIDDCLSATSATTDYEGDETWDGETWTEGTDFYLAPLHEYPKTRFVPMLNRNYTLAIRDRYLRLTGTWGYGDGINASPWAAQSINATVATTAGVTLTLSAAGLQAGQTIKVEDEQMFVSAVASATAGTPPVTTYSATVTRGVNGTTAAAHTSKAVSLALYPALVTQCAVVLAAMDYTNKAGVEFSQERIGDYSYTRAGSQAREELKERYLAGLRRF